MCEPCLTTLNVFIWSPPSRVSYLTRHLYLTCHLRQEMGQILWQVTGKVTLTGRVRASTLMFTCNAFYGYQSAIEEIVQNGWCLACT